MKKGTKKKKFLVRSDLAEVGRTSKKVLAFLKPLALSDAGLFDIRLCLEEALINAIKYGHCFDKKLKVVVEVSFTPSRLQILVEDRGKGFDVRALADCTQNTNLFKNSGRGVHLIRQLMDRAAYNARGNRLVMVKNFKRTNKNEKQPA